VDDDYPHAQQKREGRHSTQVATILDKLGLGLFISAVKETKKFNEILANLFR
jgi:hypothetical protein